MCGEEEHNEEIRRRATGESEGGRNEGKR